MVKPSYEQAIQLERVWLELKAKLDAHEAQRLIEHFNLVGQIAGGQFDLQPTAQVNRDMRKEGWKLLEHIPRSVASVGALELVSFLEEGEGFISGDETVRRARGLNADYGQEDAEWLLEHQEEIPEEFRKFYLLFPRTVWQGSDGDRRVVCLGWRGRRWDLGFAWLDDGFDSGSRLLRSRK
ncbi:MAG: hypothetical protein A2719_02575 [Candidatus Ryanbacteria bacterium RIFCSPHIGHO2_01_FULL_45_22]|uniref:Uncharacterized protein n=1 Tax=Candidatus Ryanbacteria bacterium RIFCSPHIGHO2_01_FULL_45_22 TaxID=1802114 RepID=A0A1G2G146_9BACT|nr:MAG: hypothetical protein A2719_02575 [Candidatus Ryanbacteria bacterium RIFCSPHIGHO2_01_FULL_45_22]